MNMLVSIEVEEKENGIVLTVRENNRLKENKYQSIFLSLEDLTNYKEVGRKLEVFGNVITNHDK